MATKDFQQTGTAASFGTVQSCSPNALASGGNGPKAIMATVGGSAGTTQLFTVNASSTRSTLMFQMAPGVSGWSAGNLVVPIVIPGAGVNANLTIVRADACRRTSGDVAVGSYGSQTFSISLSASGTKTLTIPVSLSVGSATDILYVVVSIANAAGTAQSSRFTPSALITSPILDAEVVSIQVFPAPAAFDGVVGPVVGAAIELLPAPAILDALGSPIVGASVEVYPAPASLEGEGGPVIGAEIELLPAPASLEGEAEPEVPAEDPEIEMRVTRLRAEVSAKKVLERTVTPLDLPEVVPNALLHDWSAPLEVETSWMTDVAESSETEIEERISLRNRPIRTQRSRLSGMERSHSSKIVGNLARLQHSRLPVPLYCDESPLTSAYSSGATLACDTSHRRFYKGGRVIVGLPDSGILINAEYGIIESLNEDSITLTDDLTSAHPLGSVVYPCMDAEKRLSQSTILNSDHHISAGLECTEVTGSSALPASAEPSLDEVELVHNGVPVWILPSNWVGSFQGQIQRLGESITLGVGKFVALRGRRPRFILPFKISWFDRETFWKLLNFFDSRRGRARTFIVANPQTLYSVEAVDSTSVTVVAEGNLEDHEEFFDKIILETFNSAPVIRDISSIEDLGSSWKIHLSVSLDSVPDISDIKKASSGHLVRMSSDTLKEVWFTTKHGEASLSFLDIPDEKPVEIDGLYEPSYFDANINLSSLFLWADANRNVSKITGTSTFFTRDGLISGADELPAQIIDDTRLNIPEIYSRGLIFPEPFLMPSGSILNEMPILIRPDKWKTNKGRDCTETLEDSGHWKLQYQNGAKWWNDATGITLWWVGRLPIDNLVDQGFVFNDVKSFTTNGFYWGHDKVRVGSLNLSYSSIGLKSIKIYTMRWEPGTSVKVWRNGKQMASTTTSVPSSCSAGGQATQVGSGESTTTDTSVGKDNKIGQHGYFSCCLIFTEALSEVAMNLVGEYLAKLYTKDWKAITL